MTDIKEFLSEIKKRCPGDKIDLISHDEIAEAAIEMAENPWKCSHCGTVAINVWGRSCDDGDYEMCKFQMRNKEFQELVRSIVEDGK